MPLTSEAKADGRFGKQDFAPTTRAKTSTVVLPGEKLTWRYSNVEAGRRLHNYLDDEMRRLHAETEVHAGKGTARQARWEHEAVLDAMQERLERAPRAMRRPDARPRNIRLEPSRRGMGATHFGLRTLEKVSAEMSLHVLAYNLKRMIAISRGAAAHPGDEGRLSTPVRVKI